MKNNLLWCLLGLLWFGCGQNNPPVPAPPVPDEKQLPPEAATVADSSYLIDDFLVAAAKTGSPYEMSKTADYPLFGFTYTPTKLSGYTVHEGGYDTELAFDAKTGKYTGKAIPGLDAFEFVVAVDGSIHLTFLKSKKTYIFRKVPDPDSALRRVLFEGHYTDAKTTTPVIFRADGTLTGLGTEKTYQPIYDFMGGPLDFDEMIVRDKADESKETYYHYRFKGNTLELYDVIQPKNGDGVEKIGALRYTLAKE